MPTQSPRHAASTSSRQSGESRHFLTSEGIVAASQGTRQPCRRASGTRTCGDHSNEAGFQAGGSLVTAQWSAWDSMQPAPDAISNVVLHAG